MSNRVLFIAVSTASLTLSAFVTLEYTFGDVFTRSLASDVSEVLTTIWGAGPPSGAILAAMGVIYIIVAVVGGGAGIIVYKILKQVLTTLSRNSRTP